MHIAQIDNDATQIANKGYIPVIVVAILNSENLKNACIRMCLIVCGDARCVFWPFNWDSTRLHWESEKWSPNACGCLYWCLIYRFVSDSSFNVENVSIRLCKASALVADDDSWRVSYVCATDTRFVILSSSSEQRVPAFLFEVNLADVLAVVTTRLMRNTILYLFVLFVFH